MSDNLPSDKPIPGLSGKKVTRAVIGLLLIIGISISYPLWTYGRLDVAREESAVAWRGLAEQLNARYRTAERSLADAIASGEAPIEMGELFQLSVERFRTSTIRSQQSAAAAEIELLLADERFAPLPPALDTPAAPLQAAVEKYDQHVERERRIRESLGGRILGIFLNVPSPQPFELGY